MGLSRSRSRMIIPGLMSKTLLAASVIFSSETFPVPKVSTMKETGFATPMA